MTRNRLPIKTLADGRSLLNLGSSARVAPGWNNIDFSWLVRLAKYKRTASALHNIGLISTGRYQRLCKLGDETICWDLRRGIPFGDQSFDVVYHSHLLEHVDRDAAPGFLKECYRVLKPGGILRVVVPDLETLSRSYLACVDNLPHKASEAEHQLCIERLIDQMIVRVPLNRKNEPRVVQWIEHILIGNTDRAGVLHRWMYDRFSLSALMRQVGFTNVCVCDCETSNIPQWNSFALDLKPNGQAYKRDSIYVEATRSADLMPLGTRS